MNTYPWKRMDVSRENWLWFIKIQLTGTLEQHLIKEKSEDSLDWLSAHFNGHTLKDSMLLIRNYDKEIKWKEVRRVFWLLSTENHIRCDLRLLSVAGLRHSHTELLGTYIISRSPNPENAPFGMTRSLVRTNLLKREWTWNVTTYPFIVK